MLVYWICIYNYEICFTNVFASFILIIISSLLRRLKSRSARVASHHLTFMGNCWTVSHMFYSLIFLMDEFSLKEIRTWGWSKISSCFFVWCKSTSLLQLKCRVRGEPLLFVASVKILECRGEASHHPIFMGNCLTTGHAFSLIYPVDECSFKEMKMWDQSEIPFYCFVFGVN